MTARCDGRCDTALGPAQRPGRVSRQRRHIVARGWLLLVVLGQVLLTPLLAFGLTYLFDVQLGGDAVGVSIRRDHIAWILSASASYGLLALALALVIGGYTPMWVVDRGGWAAALGLSRRRRDAELISRSELALRRSPHGRMLSLVSDRLEGRRGLIETHGALQLLAAPLQLGLAVIPVLAMVLVPAETLRAGHLLELGMIAYLIMLIVVLHLHPVYARRFIPLANFTRTWLVRMTRLSWLAPVLIMWLLSRIAALLVVDLLDADLPRAEFLQEQRWLEALLGVPVTVPESAFLDLLVALAVLPIASFTTVATVSGAGRLPGWFGPPELIGSTGTAPRRALWRRAVRALLGADDDLVAESADTRSDPPGTLASDGSAPPSDADEPRMTSVLDQLIDDARDREASEPDGAPIASARTIAPPDPPGSEPTIGSQLLNRLTVQARAASRGADPPDDLHSSSDEDEGPALPD